MASTPASTTKIESFGAPGAGADAADEKLEIPAKKKVAILMIALGQENTAEVMKYLSDSEIEEIAQSIAELDVVTTEQEDDVLEEFEQLLIAGKYVSQGGLDFARGALEKAMGPRSWMPHRRRVSSTASRRRCSRTCPTGSPRWRTSPRRCCAS